MQSVTLACNIMSIAQKDSENVVVKYRAYDNIFCKYV